MAVKIRHVKTIVQHHFVLDDGDFIIEVPLEEPKEIAASEWPDYSSQRFPREVQEWQTQINSEDESHDNPSVG